MKVGPQLETAAQQSDDLVLRRIDIVSWKSPVVKQHGIESIPHVVLYDPRGKVVAEGKEAYARVRRWADEEPAAPGKGR